MNHFSELPERHQRLVAREEDFNAKIEHLFAKTALVVLSGTSGVGKSTIACEFAHYIKQKRGADFHDAKWFESDCLEKLEINYVANMTPDEHKHLLTEKNKLLVVQEINKELAKQTESSKLLVIFDGVHEIHDPLFELIYKELPANVHCLITTNQVNFKDKSKFEVLEVRPFNRKESEAFISKSIPRIGREFVDDVLKLCGAVFLPFRLAQISMNFAYFKEKSASELVKEISMNTGAKSLLHLMFNDMFDKHHDERELIKCIAFVNSDCISKLFMGNFASLTENLALILM